MDNFPPLKAVSLGNASSNGTCSHVSCSQSPCHDKGGQPPTSSPEKSNKATGNECSPPFSFGRQGFSEGEVSSKKPAYGDVLQFGLPHEDAGLGTHAPKPGFSDSLKKFAPSDSYLSARHCEGSEVTFDEDELYDIPNDWGHCLLGLFAGRFPGIKAVFSIVERWKANCRVLTHPSGWIIFKFANAEDMLRILASKPENAYGRTLLLKSVPSCFTFDDMDISHVPVWIRLKGLPLECWHPKALSKIATKVGKPICCDEATLGKRRISYARILVEVDARKAPISSVPIALPNGVHYEQGIEYEHTPKLCSSCKRFGHYSDFCPTVIGASKARNGQQQEHRRTGPKETNSNLKSWQKVTGTHVRFPSSDSTEHAQEPSHGELVNKSEQQKPDPMPKVDQLGLTNIEGTSAKPTGDAIVGKARKSRSVSPITQRKSRSASPLEARKSTKPNQIIQCETTNSFSALDREKSVSVAQGDEDPYHGMPLPNNLDQEVSKPNTMVETIVTADHRRKKKNLLLGTNPSPKTS